MFYIYAPSNTSRTEILVSSHDVVVSWWMPSLLDGQIAQINRRKPHHGVEKGQMLTNLLQNTRIHSR